MISSSRDTDTTTAIQSAAELALAIGEESAEFEALLQLLREEQQALQAQDLDRICSLALTKNDRLARLGALGAARSKFVDANRPNSSGAQMQAYLDSAVRESWRRLLALAGEAHRTNVVNGKLIAAQMRYTSGALAVLQQAASNLMCYGADGTTQSVRIRRPLASA